MKIWICDPKNANGQVKRRQNSESAAKVESSKVADRVQLLSQARIRRGFDPPFRFTADDGGEREWKFPGHSSGRFGYDLDPSKWISVAEATRRWNMFDEIKSLDFDMVLDNWFDFHVTTAKVLENR